MLLWLRSLLFVLQGQVLYNHRQYNNLFEDFELIQTPMKIKFQELCVQYCRFVVRLQFGMLVIEGDTRISSQEKYRAHSTKVTNP